jgi:hypothetical protein
VVLPSANSKPASGDHRPAGCCSFEVFSVYLSKENFHELYFRHHYFGAVYPRFAGALGDNFATTNRIETKHTGFSAISSTAKAVG